MNFSRRFISGLETCATLGLMETFSVYQPAFENANFLEVQHWGDALTRSWQEDDSFSYRSRCYAPRPANPKALSWSPDL